MSLELFFVQKIFTMGASKFILAIPFFCIVLFMNGCKAGNSDSKQNTESDTATIADEGVRKAKSIFYHMYLPNEMYKIFEKAGAVYDVKTLNPVENVNLYETSAKAALNLGVYGVDLSYNKMFGQNQKTLLYFTVIHKLSQQLGIPDNQFAVALKRMEKHVTNRDSLTKYATDIYVSTNKYLNDNERRATSALVITGGWVEAVYIAAKISDENGDNNEIIERIAFQKYSLRNLISLLSNHQSDPTVARYLLMLKSLNRCFERFEIYYDQEDLSIDTINKLISANKIEFNLSKQDVKEIKTIISQIRNDIVQ
jgi:hypothetical protein